MVRAAIIDGQCEVGGDTLLAYWAPMEEALLLRLYTAKYNYRTMNLAYHFMPISWNAPVVNTVYTEQRHDTAIKTVIRQIKFLKTAFIEHYNLRRSNNMKKKRPARKISFFKRENSLADYRYFRSIMDGLSVLSTMFVSFRTCIAECHMQSTSSELML